MLIIQKIARGKKVRKDVKKMNRAAAKIQCLSKMKILRKDFLLKKKKTKIIQVKNKLY